MSLLDEMNAAETKALKPDKASIEKFKMDVENIPNDPSILLRMMDYMIKANKALAGAEDESQCKYRKEAELILAKGQSPDFYMGAVYHLGLILDWLKLYIKEMGQLGSLLMPLAHLVAHVDEMNILAYEESENSKGEGL